MPPRLVHRLGLVALLLAACADAEQPLGPNPEAALQRSGILDPSLVAIDLGGATRHLWPFASASLETSDDPINLILTGTADPRNIRNALLALDGNRGAPFPPVFPFTCTWSDAIGGLMAGYGAESGWAGGAIQLQCGSYGPIRFHLRLFDLGDYTVANAHFEVVIPGTADHQVLSWELAEQLVTYDLARTGLLAAAPSVTAPINPAPSHRWIPGVIYNGLPADLRALIGGPAVPTGDVGIASDGRATVFALAGQATPGPAPTVQVFTIIYDQVIPKPFCDAGPGDFVQVHGPVTLEQHVDPGDGYRMSFRAQGDLAVLPIDITTGRPSGDPLRARLSESQDTEAGDRGGEIRGAILQSLLPRGEVEAGGLRIEIKVGLDRPAKYDRNDICSPK
jgi:hypothetical protein